VEVGGKEGRGEEAVEGTTYVWAPTWTVAGASRRLSHDQEMGGE
jgi:hypothetical protein